MPDPFIDAVKRHPATMVKNRLHQKRRSGTPQAKYQAYTVAQLLERYRDPRAILLEIAATDTHKLAAEANCTFLEALAERRMCAQAVLPYVVQKLPVQVDMRHTKAIHLNIVDERQYTELITLAATDAADNDIDLQLLTTNSAETIENQDTGQGTGDKVPG